jgi:hypothetical protein
MPERSLLECILLKSPADGRSDLQKNMGYQGLSRTEWQNYCNYEKNFQNENLTIYK